MGLEVVLEDETGRKIDSVEDPKNLLHRVLPSPGAADFQCLNKIDWYGDTVFNRHQIPTVRAELRRLAQSTRDRDALSLVLRIDALAARGQSEPHIYLKFYGD
jgi:hypothetical protein